MSLTFKITKLQLANLVYSPISWGVLLAFALYSGILFTSQMDQMSNYYLSRPQGDMFTWQLVNYQGFIGSVANLLFLFIPLLGMGLISNEMNSGTIKLLYSSPIKIKSIVLGKFLAMVVFNGFIFLQLLLVGLGASFFIDHIDWGIVLSFCVGIYVLSCTYGAITLFMSSLTRYQIISAILTIALIFGLENITDIETSMPVVRDILPWLSITGHARNMLEGYFITSDLLYFIAITVLFLFFAILKMQSDRLASKEQSGVYWKGAVAVVCFLGVMYLGNLPKLKGYADFTEVKRHTLPDYGIDMLKRFKGEELNLELVGNAISAVELSPAALSGTLNGFGNYTRFKPDLKVSANVFYATPSFDMFDGPHKDLDIHQKMDLIARYRGFDRDKIPYIDDLPNELKSFITKDPSLYGALTMFKYNGKTSGVIGGSRNDNLMQPTHVDDFTALTRFFEPYKKVTFLQGNKERQINRGQETDWSQMATHVIQRFALIHNGFEVKGIDAKNETIPLDTDILVIADPWKAYSVETTQAIKAYIDSGKNVVIAVDDKSVQPLSDILEYVGVEVLGKITTDEPGVLNNAFNVQYSTNAPEQFTTFTNSTFSLDTGLALQVNTNKGFTADSVLQTNAEYSWVAQDSTKTKKVLTTTWALSRERQGKTQRILVTGAPDLMSNKVLSQNMNTTFAHVPTSAFRGYFHWLTNGVYPIDMPLFSSGGKDNSLTTSLQKVKTYKLIYIGLLPFLIALTGATIWFKRSRK